MNTLLKRSSAALGLLGLALTGCQPDLDAPQADKGTADFSNYVAVGNSLTAGYQSGGLFNEGIQNSYPNILSKQFAKAGGGAFVQPLFADNQKDGSGYLNFQGFTATGSPILLSPGQNGNTRTYQLAYTGQTLISGERQLAAYAGAQPNNLGIPGISVLSSVAALTGGLAPYGLLNPYLNRLLPAAERPTVDYLTYIGRATPSFFTCWLGSNDVLTYATAGGVASPSNPFSGLTDTTRFGQGYRTIVRTITKNGTVKGVIANIPSVTDVPYFTAVPVATAIASIKGNTALPNAAQASLYIRTGAGAVREATANDLLTLTASSVIGTATPGVPLPVGVGYSATQANPLPSQYVLDADELAAVRTRTTELNKIIDKTARQYNVPLFDVNAFFSTVAKDGFAINGTANSTSFISGNLFSLDGIHLSSRGYAVIANEYIRVINEKYKSSIPFANPDEYQAVLFP
ncbi:SGNH/GDSL hydrolase family protein [Hymenobacter crusticola]|uniref:G-D-S-L family lipolytic protein n=1 Tax=Hymenobacter crusticola TaxID=1770526 RepID=A0A243W8J2_9BACT|nr:SGNH/GDSL hydrolase family protein [Hymenobacter crusticola]OUJ71642.1 hypothetical protein BXP70_21420 [Hymenobacter crusticola]